MVEMTTWEGENMDFGEPQIYLLEYGGVNIISRTNVVNTLKDCIRNWRRFEVTNNNLGGDPKPGSKEFWIVYRRAPGTALTQFVRGEYTTIYFERQIFSITYGNKIILNDAWLYANANDVMQANMFGKVADRWMMINNENMRGDPQPGVYKNCVVEIDGFNTSTGQPQWLTASFGEGHNFPIDSIEGGIPGVVSRQGKVFPGNQRG